MAASLTIMAASDASYREMIQDALRNQPGTTLSDLTNYVFTNYRVRKGFASWVEHILKQMVGKGEVKKENNKFTLVPIPPRPRKKYVVSMWHGHTSEEGEEDEVNQDPSSSKAIRKFQAKLRRKRKKKPPSPYEIQVRERQEKECFFCERKACTSCRRTPQEIFQTRQKLWAKALEEEARYLQRTKVVL
jgi:hypothetical protein